MNKAGAPIEKRRERRPRHGCVPVPDGALRTGKEKAPS